MTQYSLAPGFCLLHYVSGGGHQHVMTIPVEPESLSYSPGDAVNLKPAGGAAVSLSTAHLNLADAMAPAYTLTDNLSYMEYWQKINATADPVFINSSTLTGAGGSSSLGGASYAQMVFSYRTSLGNLLRVYLMETVVASDQIFNAGDFTGGVLEDFVAYMASPDCIFRGRDGGKPISLVRGVSKINDALRKKYLLQ